MGNFILSSILKNYDFYQMHSVWEEWQIVEQKGSFRICKIIKHRKKSSLYGQPHHSMQSDNLQKCLKILQFRKTYCQSSIVGIHGVYRPKNEQGINFNFCGQFENHFLITQHMPFCFSDVGLIEFPNGIYILKNAFQAAKLIKQKLNITTLYDQNMIFFDSQNKCKIWINEDISQNRVMDVTQVSQSESIKSIFVTVQMKIKNSQNFENYLRLKQQFELKTFMQAINFVNNFQSQALKLTKIQQNSTLQSLSCKNSNKISQVKTQKPKKSLSTRKKNLYNEKVNNFSSIKKLNRNTELEQNRSINFSRSSKFKENASENFQNVQKSYQRICFQNKLSVNSFLKNEDLKKQELKKQRIRTNQARNKFYDCSIKEISFPQKPLSTLSTNQQSFEISQTSEIYKQEISHKKYNQQINNSGQNLNKFQNIYTGHDKLSLSEYHCRLKKNVSLPVFQGSFNTAFS